MTGEGIGDGRTGMVDPDLSNIAFSEVDILNEFGRNSQTKTISGFNDFAARGH